MNLKDIILSYPAIRYQVDVSHFTSRNSTAIEWLILEVTQKVMTNPQLGAVPITLIFEQLFQINDVNRIIKPCILDLRDGGALITEGIYDDTDLGDIPMRNLRLTEDGQRMQRDGLLPGRMSEDSIIVNYDPIQQQLLTGNVDDSYSASATGVHLREVEDLSEEPFPSSLIMEHLSAAKKNQRYRWMTQTTQIHEALPREARVLWKNISRKLQVGKGWRCFIDDDEDGSFAARLLGEMTIDFPAAYADAPEIDHLDPEQNIKNLIEPTTLSGYLNQQVRQDSLFVIRQDHFPQEIWVSPGHKIKRLRVAIIESAKEMSVSFVGNRMEIYLPDQLLEDGVLYRSEDTMVCIGRAHLNAADITREAVFAYLPAGDQTAPLLSAAIMEIVDNYAATYPKLLYLLLEIDRKERFYEIIEKTARQLDNLAERHAFLDTINRDGLQIYGKRLLQQNQYSDLLLNTDRIKGQTTSFGEIEQIISEYTNISEIRNQDDLLHNVVQAALESRAQPRNLAELWHLWKHLQATKKNLLSWVCSQKLYMRFYTPEILDQIAKKVSFAEEPAIEKYTPIESAFWDLEWTARRVLEKLPELDIGVDYSSERVLECVLMHRENIQQLHSEIRNWDDAVQSFEVRVGSFAEAEISVPNLHMTAVLMNRLRNALSIFFDEAALKFQRVYVVDTCALMHIPELISTFVDEKSLLIVPVLVQDELDGKKKDRDEETAFHAREAIRQIEMYRENDWLDNTQSSQPELLSPDLDPERNDNKILSICIKYIYKNVILITDDANLRNLAHSQNIRSMESESYMKAKAHESSEGASKKKKGKKKRGK